MHIKIKKRFFDSVFSQQTHTHNITFKAYICKIFISVIGRTTYTNLFGSCEQTNNNVSRLKSCKKKQLKNY